MADAKILRTKIETHTKDKNIPSFTANGSRVLFDGWLKADPEARGEDTVERRRRSSPLNVTEDGDASLEAGPALDLLGEPGADPLGVTDRTHSLDESEPHRLADVVGVGDGE